jgi:SAM-dependent methyltransferase
MLNFVIDLKKFLPTLLSLSLCLAAGMSSAVESNKYLDVNDRPTRLREAINKKFDSVVNRGDCIWTNNGRAKYLMLRLDDDVIVKKIIDGSPDQEVFNFIDIGAGDHRWGRARAEFLNKEFADRAVHFNIFSLAGDNYQTPDTIIKNGVNIVQKEIGLCSIYNLSAFSIENLIETLKSIEYFDMLFKEVDLAVSSYTLVHLVDPTGAFLQIHDLLRPGSGVFLVVNMFRMSGHDDDLVIEFLRHSNLEFVKRYADNSFAVRRSPEGNPGQLPYHYIDEEIYDTYPRAKLVLVEQDLNPNPKNTISDILGYQGSKSLLDWLRHPTASK